MAILAVEIRDHDGFLRPEDIAGKRACGNDFTRPVLDYKGGGTNIAHGAFTVD
ncbi:hypothetical protein CSC26_7063 (plasmid) [Pseudomonas aeruginosa]|nr:hypothetical protein CSC26_7063 [Pseudomonas aeruginosa]